MICKQYKDIPIRGLINRYKNIRAREDISIFEHVNLDPRRGKLRFSDVKSGLLD